LLFPWIWRWRSILCGNSEIRCLQSWQVSLPQKIQREIGYLQ
jgi:hypothetical protein